MHEPPRSPDRDLPVGHPLQVAANFGFSQRRFGDEWHWRRELGVDQLGRLTSPVQRTVHDPPQAAVSERLTNGSSLRSPQRAEGETGQISIQDAVRVLDVGVAHQEDTCRPAQKVQLVALNPAIVPSGSCARRLG